jgi:hypothetical protein
MTVCRGFFVARLNGLEARSLFTGRTRMPWLSSSPCPIIVTLSLSMP